MLTGQGVVLGGKVVVLVAEKSSSVNVTPAAEDVENPTASVKRKLAAATEK